MSDLRIPTVTVDAQVILTDGRSYPGHLFAPAEARDRSIADRASLVLNGPAEFFPFQTLGPTPPMLINKREVALVSIDRWQGENGDERFGVSCDVEVECAGQRLRGKVRIDTPSGRRRLLDYLNTDERFLAIVRDDNLVLVQKDRITQVVECAAAEPPSQAEASGRAAAHAHIVLP